MKNKKLIGMAAGVGLCSGLFGGDVVVGIKVNENKADLNNQAVQSFQNLQTAVKSMLNQQKHGLYYN